MSMELYKNICMIIDEKKGIECVRDGSNDDKKA